MTKADVVRVSELDWPALGGELDRWGFAVTPPLLDEEQCRELSDLFDVDEAFRSTIVMSRHAFGEGTYRYFADPLPASRAAAPGRAVRAAGEDRQPSGRTSSARTSFPDTLDGLVEVCAAAGQHRPTPLLLRYWAGGYNCLHQDLYGEVAFPLQVTIMLSAPDEDFTGGENVLVEQRPRAQSRPVVARLGRGRGVALPDAETGPCRASGDRSGSRCGTA